MKINTFIREQGVTSKRNNQINEFLEIKKNIIEVKYSIDRLEDKMVKSLPDPREKFQKIWDHGIRVIEV